MVSRSRYRAIVAGRVFGGILAALALLILAWLRTGGAIPSWAWWVGVGLGALVGYTSIPRWQRPDYEGIHGRSPEDRRDRNRRSD